MTLYKQQVGYLLAGIPERFWSFTYRDLTKTFRQANSASLGLFKIWSDDLASILQIGASLMLWSADHGTAKSALASVPARKALDGNKRVLWLSGMTLFDELCLRDTSMLLWAKIDQTDLLVLDEIDKVFAPGETKYAWGHLTEFFNRLYEQKVPVISTANQPLADLSNIYPTAVFDRIQEWDSLEFYGVNYRFQISYLEQIAKKTYGK